MWPKRQTFFIPSVAKDGISFGNWCQLSCLTFQSSSPRPPPHPPVRNLHRSQNLPRNRHLPSRRRHRILWASWNRLWRGCWWSRRAVETATVTALMRKGRKMRRALVLQVRTSPPGRWTTPSTRPTSMPASPPTGPRPAGGQEPVSFRKFHLENHWGGWNKN